jgi:predicted Zn-dependent protease
MAEPIGREAAAEAIQAALDLPGADAVEVLLYHEWGGLTRFANSSIHQSTSKEDTSVRIRAIRDGRTGVAETNDLSEDGVRHAARNALEMAAVAVPDPLFPGLAQPATPESKNGFDESTADVSPQSRAEAVAALVGEVGDGFRAAGAVETEAAEVALANTEGQFCYATFTRANASAVVSGGRGGTGTAEAAAPAFGSIDPVAVGKRAYGKARDSQDPADVAPGVYEVILEPLAVSTLVDFLAYIALNGRAIAERRSPLAGREGARIAAEMVSLVDDPLSEDAIGLPFDFEGTAKRPLGMLDGGVFVSGVHDRRSAKQAGAVSTGHALPAPNPNGPFPLNMRLEPGTSSVEDMVGAIGRGLLVTRFHYSNIVQPMETILTGMTRDGTWLIENGRISGPVKNLRFTQSILQALSDVEMVGRDVESVGEFTAGGTRVPALKISRFNFSGASDH